MTAETTSLAQPNLSTGSRSWITEIKPTPRERDRVSRATGSAAPAAAIVRSYSADQFVDLDDIMCKLEAQSDAIHVGDMAQVESMLLHQAVALNGMFANLAVRAAQKYNSLSATQTLTQLALKAQSGCRATLQTLGEIKSPKQVAFVKQANIAQNQQVNNGMESRPREGNIKPKPIELLAEEPHGSTQMDTGAKSQAGGADQDLVSVGTVNRPTKPRRKATRGA